MWHRDAVGTLVISITCLPLSALRKVHTHWSDVSIGNTEKIEMYETGTKKGKQII